jgi:glycosyltransferase involved in cell wall biosynthesis
MPDGWNYRRGERESPRSPFDLIEEFERLDADVDVLRLYQDGITNIIFIGRLWPLWRGGYDLLETFAHYHHRFNLRSRLYLVLPEAPRRSGESTELRRAIDQAQLTDVCTWTVAVTAAQLKAYYLITHAFLCVSQYPDVTDYLVLALYHRTPIVAWATAPVRQLLGEDALAWDEFNSALLAQSLRQCVEDHRVTEYLRQRQQARFDALLASVQNPGSPERDQR